MDKINMFSIFNEKEQEELIKKGYENYIPKSINLEERIKLDRNKLTFSMFTKDGEKMDKYKWKSWVDSISDEISWSEGYFNKITNRVYFIGEDKIGYYYTCDLPFRIMWCGLSYEEVEMQIRLMRTTKLMEDLSVNDEIIMKAIIAIQKEVACNVLQYLSYEEMKVALKIAYKNPIVFSGFTPEPLVVFKI